MPNQLKVSEHFDIREFVPKSTFKTFEANSAWFVRPELIKLAEFIRKWFNAPVTINNWHVKGPGEFQYRGFRPRSYAEGGTYSQHRLGCAMDFNVKGFTPKQIFDEILANEKEFLKAGLTTMENIPFTTTWNHIDIRHTGLDHILIVNP